MPSSFIRNDVNDSSSTNGQTLSGKVIVDDLLDRLASFTGDGECAVEVDAWRLIDFCSKWVPCDRCNENHESVPRDGC